MKLLFHGTRGETRESTKQHRLHTSTLISHGRTRVMVDAGKDWLGRLEDVNAHAIVLTHAHPDHAHGLKQGAPCPVYGTMDTFSEIGSYPVGDPRLVEHRKPFTIGGITFEAFPVEHSITSPTVAYRVTAGQRTVFLSADLIYVHEKEEALAGVDLYVGDAATLSQSFVRRRGKRLIGHSPVRTQINWCAAAGIPRAIFTHAGPEVVSDHGRAARQIAEWGVAKGVEASLAVDGLGVVVR